MRAPEKTIPRAFYTAVAAVIVLYVLVALVTVGNLSVAKIAEAQDYALAEAARPFLGNAGFILIAIAALLSTLSAINATLYGSARLCYSIAKDRELPEFLEKKVWDRPLEGLAITALLALLLANLGDLSSISMMGSAGFLLVFAAVNVANVVAARETKSIPWLSAVGAATCILALGALVWHVQRSSPARLFVLAGMIALAVVVESGYRLTSRRSLRLQ